MAACAAAGAATCRRLGGEQQVLATLLFGSERPDGNVVDDAAWSGFLRDEVTPRFPDGLTAFSAYGQWRDPRNGQISREPSRVVMIAARDEAGLAGRLSEVVHAYKLRFQQRSAGVLLMPVCAGF